MHNPVATINCPNPQCQTPNPLDHKFCQKCRTPLIKRYLRAVGEAIDGDLGGAILAGRYLSKGNRILLDTQPSLPPQTTEEIPEAIAPYLKLSPYKLHLPQIYGLAARSQNQHPVWLLEQVPVYSGGVDSSVEGQLMPELAAAWKTAPGLRQLNWLWQIAQLWHPLSTCSVTASLLTPGLLRVEGSILRLLDLQPDHATPTLQQLGKLWSQWVEESQPVIKNFLAQLCQQLEAGEISHSDQLVALLEGGIVECGQAQSNTYQIATLSDTGPSRRRNEDSCYPPSGSTSATQTNALLGIVCDGIGGHEGGDIASSLAIETIRERVEKLSASWDWHPTTVSVELENSACAANDMISQRNDTEQRQERQRMGTTVVMALAHQYEIYITHVGDSRVYRVSRTGCHQVTLDDDLASREVRLGYALYRDALQHPASGSLVQALGMGASGMLHPTVQRFIVDEDCVFLLCTDGLSDHDRVEQYWETEILPILDGQVNLKTAAQRLVQMANSQNGHDNVTVALVHCQVRQGEKAGHQLSAPAAASLDEDSSAVDPSRIKTQRLSPNPTPKRSGMLLGLLLLMGLCGGVAYGFVSGLLPGIFLSSAPEESPAVSETPSPTPSASPPVSKVRSLFQIKSNTTKNPNGQAIPLLLRSGFDQPQSKSVLGLVPATSILQVLEEQQSVEQENWLKLKVCSTAQSPKSNSPTTKPAKEPSPRPKQVWQAPPINKSPGINQKPTTVTYFLLQPGESGWIRGEELLPVSTSIPTANTTQLGKCANTGSASATSTPTLKPSASP